MTHPLGEERTRRQSGYKPARLSEQSKSPLVIGMSGLAAMRIGC